LISPGAEAGPGFVARAANAHATHTAARRLAAGRDGRGHLVGQEALHQVALGGAARTGSAGVGAVLRADATAAERDVEVLRVADRGLQRARRQADVLLDLRAVDDREPVLEHPVADLLEALVGDVEEELLERLLLLRGDLLAREP